MLVCHRRPDSSWYPDVWDLPGGHLAPGETSRQALIRELREELDVEVRLPDGIPLEVLRRPGEPDRGAPLAMLFIPTLIGYFVSTVVVALIARGIGATEVMDGVWLGVALGVGFGVVGALVSQLYEQKESSYWLINGVNAIIAYIIVAVIVTVWD